MSVATQPALSRGEPLRRRLRTGRRGAPSGIAAIAAAQLTGQVRFELTRAGPFVVRMTSMLPMHQSVCALPLTVFVPNSANDAPMRNLPKRR